MYFVLGYFGAHYFAQGYFPEGALGPQLFPLDEEAAFNSVWD